ncbi:hypothetical protein Tco_0646683 [Tanacetum coccineum]
MRDHVNDRFDEFDIKRRDFEMASSHDFHEIEEVLQEDRDKAISFDPVKEPLDFERTKKFLKECFDIGSCDVEDSPVNDRFAKVEGMHVVPPSMNGIYIPSKSDFGIDESKFTYDPK